MKYDQIKTKLKNYKRYILGAKNSLLSAVMIPLVEVDGELHILFEIRSPNLRSQPCDVSFPGGKIDKSDQSAAKAATREVCEELGVSEKDIEIIAELDLFVAPHGVIIHNFVGKINDISKISPNSNEVYSVFTVPISFFQQNEPLVYHNQVKMIRSETFPFHLIPYGKNYPFRDGVNQTLFWQYNGNTIWGFTAAIVKNFIEILGGSQR